MTTTQEIEEAPITTRVAERPAIEPKKLKQVEPRDLAIRFVAGGLTSVGAGIVTIVFGARAGGIFLAFPAILAASLTLIEQKDDSVEAREDARGAVLGGCALALFAAVAAICFGHLNAAVALLLATVAWFAGALVGYVAVWLR